MCPECGSSDLLFSIKRKRYRCESCGHDFAPPSAPVGRRIFISYGHDEHVSLARRLKTDLEARGHEVWFDVDRLKPGTDWERYIEDGLEWASSVPGAGRMLLLLTPHSVRRPDGFCLNEIARAVQRNLRVVPVMVVGCEPPLSICRIQWLDLRDCVPLTERIERYEARFPELAAAVEEDRAVGSGQQARLLAQLQPLPFDADLAEHLPRFTGRQWVFDRVDRWLADPGASRVFWITGKPGVGKTALAAWLCFKRPEVAAFHLCRHGDDQKGNPRRAVLSIAYQLSSQLPDYRDRLTALNLDELAATANARTLFDSLIVQPLASSPATDRTLLVVIDGLDEATEGGRNELASFIASEFARTPPWLRLLVTSRPDPEIVHLLQGLSPCVLDASEPENRADIRAYLVRELAVAGGQRQAPSAVVDAIVERSEGLFLYAEWIRREIALGRLSLDRPEEFPQGLGGVYAQFFDRQFPSTTPSRPGQPTAETFKTRWRPVLEAVVASREALPVDDLTAGLGWDEYDRREVLDAFGSLLIEADGRVRPFHRSLVDWLTDRHCAGPFLVSRAAGEARLAEWGWAQYQRGPSSLSPYFRTHLPAHLLQTGRRPDLETLLTDLRYIEARVEAGGTFDLVADFEGALAAQAPPADQIASQKLAEYSRFVQTRSHVLAKHPSLVLQEAANQPDSSAPSGEARELWTRRSPRVPWLEWVNRPQSGDPCLMTLAGHEDAVTTCGYSPDGRWIASGSTDRSARVWNAITGQQAASRVCGPRAVRACVWSPRSDWLLLGLGDKTLQLWDPLLRTMIAELAGHTDGIVSCAVSPDGSRIASGSRDKTLIVWDVATRARRGSLEHHHGEVWACAWSADGRWILSGSADRRLILWDAATFQQIGVLEGHLQDVRSCAFSPDGALAASGSADDTLKLWDPRSRTEVATLRGHRGTVLACAFSPDGRHVVSGAGDGTIIVWEIATQQPMLELFGHARAVNACAFSPDGRRIVSGSGDGTLRVWDAGGSAAPTLQPGHRKAALACAVSPNGRTLATASGDRTLKLWSASNGDELGALEGHWDDVGACAFSADGRRLLSASHDRSLRLWDTQERREVAQLVGHNEMVTSCAFSPGGRVAASGGWDRKVRLWDAAVGREVGQLTGHTDTVAACAFSPDGRRLVSASWDRTIRVWDLRSGSVLAELSGHSDVVRSCAFSPDGKKILSASQDGTLRVWDADGGVPIVTLRGHTQGVLTCAWAPDGRYAASGGRDRTLRVWDLETMAQVGLHACSATVYGVAWAGPGIVVASDGSGRLNILKLKGLDVPPPLVLPARIFRYDQSRPDDESTVVCRWCGERIRSQGETSIGQASTAPCVRCNRLLTFLPGEAIELDLGPVPKSGGSAAAPMPPPSGGGRAVPLPPEIEALLQRGRQQLSRGIVDYQRGDHSATREILACFHAGLAAIEQAANLAPADLASEIETERERWRGRYHLVAGDAAAAHGDWDEAIKHLRDAQKLAAPEDRPKLLEMLARCLAGKGMGRLKEASPELQKGLLPPDRMSKLLDEIRRAEQDLSEAARINPSDPDIGQALQQVHDLLDQRERLSQGRSRAAEAEAAAAAGKWDEAIGHLRAAQKLAAPEDREAFRNMLAGCLAQLGVSRVNAAIKELEGRRVPLAGKSELAGTLRQAEHELAEAARLNPSSPDIERSLMQLRELMKRLSLS